MLIYSYINTNGNWENEKLCGVFPISTSVHITVYQYGKIFNYFFIIYIAQRNIKKEIFRVDIELYQHDS